MKEVIITAAVFLASIISSFAANTGEEGITKQVKKEISYPAFLKEKNKGAEVRVSFLINEEGKAEISEINTGDAQLKQYVEVALGSMTFAKDTYQAGKVINLSISFNLY